MTAATRTAPSPMAALVGTYKLLVRGQITRGRGIGLFLLSSVGIVLAFVARTGDEPVRLAVETIAEFGLALALAVSAAWIATALLSDLRDDGLLAYLWVKPTPRWTIPAASALSSATVLLPLVVLPLVIAATVSGQTEVVTSALLAAIVGIIGYSGLFVAFGARLNRSLWWALGYILVWENLIARISAGTARLSIRSYLFSILSRDTDVDLVTDGRSAVASILVPLLVGVAGVAYATRSLSRRDIA